MSPVPQIREVGRLRTKQRRRMNRTVRKVEREPREGCIPEASGEGGSDPLCQMLTTGRLRWGLGVDRCT